MDNEEFDESVQLEIDSIHAIFPKEVFIESNYRILVECANNVLLTICLPLNYPKNSPLFELSSPALRSDRRKEILTSLNNFCSQNNGEQVLYILIQNALEYFSDLRENEKNENKEEKFVKKEEEFDLMNVALPSNFYSGQAIEDRKSVFQGHVTKLESKEEVPIFLEQLKTVGKIARARHNPYAWRIVRNDQRVIEQHDCDDDGESGSASKLLRLLTQMNASGVLLVVSRWKGGNKIGPDRFRHICNAGRDALISSGFVLVKGEGEKIA